MLSFHPPLTPLLLLINQKPRLCVVPWIVCASASPYHICLFFPFCISPSSSASPSSPLPPPSLVHSLFIPSLPVARKRPVPTRPPTYAYQTYTTTKIIPFFHLLISPSPNLATLRASLSFLQPQSSRSSSIYTYRHNAEDESFQLPALLTASSHFLQEDWGRSRKRNVVVVVVVPFLFSTHPTPTPTPPSQPVSVCVSFSSKRGQITISSHSHPPPSPLFPLSASLTHSLRVPKTHTFEKMPLKLHKTIDSSHFTG